MKTLTPAYGRDYKSAAGAKADFMLNRDFILRDITSPWDGKLINAQQIAGERVLIRYKNLQRTVIVTAP